ncbi:asparagine synthetase B family protein [Terriglobus tenax]|uniref:asparagine synthetase B family protein n=1 Tax=Terriglobus tenax TaxID=1111115 RepID=UPI0021E01989|nr:asparagine synthase-related protein [Terriglobus tenax]
MSILLGLLHDPEAFASESELRHLSLSTERFATATGKVYMSGRLAMCVQPYISHERSAMDAGPSADIRGNILGFDGRLDNYQELARELGINSVDRSDSEIVLAAFEHWGENCFQRFTGDWAMALWSTRDQRLFLARDHAGSRTLYYQQLPHRVLWSTYLEPFLSAEGDVRLSEPYAASYLAHLPIGDLTPYEGIFSVLPGQSIAFGHRGMIRRTHWNPVTTGTTRYKHDAEYEEHFLALFGQAVTRRTGPGAPILAQLSGGMDSTSIVCMSDCLRRAADPHAEILDTLSYFDDSEASLNERPYFTLTEARRGKAGIHINNAFSQRTFDPPYVDDGVYRVPGADSFSVTQERKLFRLVSQKGYRSLLSGIGGDEVMGGVPNPLPELADHLVSGDLRRLISQSLRWSLVDRNPIIFTLCETALYTHRLYLQRNSPSRKLPPWMSFRLRRHVQDSVGPRGMTHRRLGVAPHCLVNASTWSSVLEGLPHAIPQVLFRPEYLYPMLDKDLVNYLFSIPREQLLRPGRRRSLMRRSLRSIVPPEILERRRKAYQLRAPLNAIGQAYHKLQHVLESSEIGRRGLVDVTALLDELKRTAAGSAEWYQPLLRTIAYELWLKASDCQESLLRP